MTANQNLPMGNAVDPLGEHQQRAVSEALQSGLAIYNWWKKNRSKTPTFQLFPDFRSYGESRGFQTETTIPGLGTVSVGGFLLRIFFTQPKVRPSEAEAAAHWTCRQIKEFALKYFLRIYSTAEPQTYPILGRPSLPKYLELLSWYPPSGVDLSGIEILQLFWKERNREPRRFPIHKRSEVIDLRELFHLYEWIIIQGSTAELSRAIMLGNSDSPRITLPTRQAVYGIVTSDLVAIEENTEDGLLGSYGPGAVYFPQEDINKGLLLQPAFETIRFKVHTNGQVWCEDTYIYCQKPDRRSFFQGNPFSSLLKILNATGQIGLTDILRHQRFQHESESTFARSRLLRLSIARYYSLLETLRTWNEIPNWLDASTIPKWVKTGRAGLGIGLERI